MKCQSKNQSKPYLNLNTLSPPPYRFWAALLISLRKSFLPPPVSSWHIIPSLWVSDPNASQVLLLPLVVICDRLISISLMSSNFLRDMPSDKIPFFLMDGHPCEKMWKNCERCQQRSAKIVIFCTLLIRIKWGTCSDKHACMGSCFWLFPTPWTVAP